jgi:hypothetical protein
MKNDDDDGDFSHYDDDFVKIAFFIAAFLC